MKIHFVYPYTVFLMAHMSYQLMIVENECYVIN